MSTDNHERPRDDGASVARISTRNLADLARAGLEITRQPLTKVDFEGTRAACERSQTVR